MSCGECFLVDRFIQCRVTLFLSKEILFNCFRDAAVPHIEISKWARIYSSLTAQYFFVGFVKLVVEFS